MTSENSSYSEPVATLLTLGRRPRGPEQWVEYQRYGFTLEHVPDLMRLAVDTQFDEYEDTRPELWALLHAWRVLGHLRAEAAIPLLVSLFDRADTEYGDEWAMEELPHILAMIGPAVFPAAEAYVLSAAKGLWGRSAACATLSVLAESFPETRDAAVQSLIALLSRYAENSNDVNAMAVGTLLDLKAIEAAPAMEAAFAADRVTLNVSGDWEEAQIELGLLAERITPKPYWGWAAHERLAPGQAIEIQPAAKRQPDVADRKRKQARKQAKETKKKQRAPKKKKR